MQIKVTTTEMLAVCGMHITITDKISSMGLSTKTIAQYKRQWKNHQHIAIHVATAKNATLLGMPQPSERLHLPFLLEDQSLETEVQEV